MLSTSKKLEIDMRRIIVRKLVVLGLSQQDIATALGIDTSSVRNDLDKIGEVEMVFDTTGLTTKERRDWAFHYSFLEYLRVKSLIGHTMMKFGAKAETDSDLADTLDVYLDTRRIMGIADGLISAIEVMINPADPPEYQPYRQLLWAVFGETVHKITKGKLLTEFHFHVCKNGVLVTRDSLPTELAVWAFDYYKNLAGIPLDQTAKMVIDDVLGTLPTDRSREIITLRFGLSGEKGLTHDEIAARFNTTRERVRQLEAKALRQLRSPDRAKRLRVFLESPFDFTRQKLGEMFTLPPPPIVYEEEGSQNVHDLLAKSVEELELSVRSYNYLKNMRIQTVGDLVQKTENEMLRTGHGFGRKSLWELKDILESMGLCFGMKIENGVLRKPTGEVVEQ